MIHSKKDFRNYVKADREANHVSKGCSSLLMTRLRGEYNVLYLWYLRRLEYVLNCQKGFWKRINAKIINRRLTHWSAFTGITIPPNTFGKGLYIPHWGAIVVNGTARFGDNCVVQSGVNVSENVRGGNHLYLAAGCKLLIGVELSDDVIVAANAVVNKSVHEANVVVAGVPAKIVSQNGFRDRKKV